MSDFIKVNLYNQEKIVRKEYIRELVKHRLGSAGIFVKEQSDSGVDIIEAYSITPQEYDRLCKELGVE